MLAGAGVQVPMSDLFGAAGGSCWPATPLAVESRSRVDSLLRLITALDFEIDLFAKLVAGGCAPTPATGRSSRSPGSGRSWPRCSSPRSATSPASTGPRSWPPGPG